MNRPIGTKETPRADATLVSRYVRIERRLAGRFREKRSMEPRRRRLDNSINSTFVQGPFIYAESH